MTDPLRDLLTDEGRRWRDALGPDPDIVALLGDPRRRRRRPILLAVAAAAIIVAAGLMLAVSPSHDSTPREGPGRTADHAASCVGPLLTVTKDGREVGPGRRPTLGTVTAGQQVTVYGRWYFAGPCQDTWTSGAGPTPAGRMAVVRLSLTASDHRQRVLATVHPDRSAAFTATLTIPADAAPGPATIDDGAGNLIDLVVAG